ncbi:Spc98 family-domain-containing protein [Staphylotrichum tortipilum]|uniref:Spindle pole body component n=1 Tax=Staphylotrichum tortipilum TaxID=2831512 RepID=A0AAN6MS24_9PEZI|nr:Spc98 family-domain-containing protein [Staphylotrichum longicolle]
MADEEDPSDLFAIPDFWRPATWLEPTATALTSSHSLSISTPQPKTIPPASNPLFTLDVHQTAFLESPQRLIHVDEIPVLKGLEINSGIFFGLPSQLQQLAAHHPSLHHLDAQPPLEPESQSEPTVDDDEDFWLISAHVSQNPPKFRSWESFRQPDQGTPTLFLLSEAGPAAFDALLASSEVTNGAPADILDTGLYCACLLNLALGLSSVIFSWDPEKNSFIKAAASLRISGMSLGLVKAVDSLCLDCGNASRHLQVFAEGTYSAASTPTRVALAGVVDRVVTMLRSELSAQGRNLRSALQLQAAVRPVQSVLSYFKTLVNKLAQQESDEGILSCLFQEAQASEYRDELLRDATREVLRTLSEPWLEFVEEWLGFKAEEGTPITKNGPGKGFVKVADKMWIDDQGFELEEAEYFLDEDKVPSFVPEDMAQTIFETGRNLRFLRDHHPDHPLSRPDIVASAMPPKLEWAFDWVAISKLEAKVNQYRDAVSRAIQETRPETQQNITPQNQPNNDPAAELEYFGKPPAQILSTLLASIDHLSQPPPPPIPPSPLTLLLHSLYLPSSPQQKTLLPPDWSLLPHLSFAPLLSTHAALLNRACTALLFRAHHLRAHIDLLRQTFLLDNGVLASRLAHALFDPDLGSAERTRGVALGTGGSGGAMGLRLGGGRRTWPPASSELRLALMGVLGECYSPFASQPHGDSKSGLKDILSNLSFAVRADMTPAEIDRCMDPAGLEALDFLRLAYRPPGALRAVLGAGVLRRMDGVFRLLLRVVRMVFVVENVLFLKKGREREGGSVAGRRLRVEGRHFVAQLAGYVFDVGVRGVWAGLDGWLDSVEGALDREEGDSGGVSPDAVREKMEAVLDEMMGALLLRKRQAPVMGLLEEIFGVMLRFAAGQGGEAEERELYKLFRRKVEVFVTVCRGLGEKMAVSGGGGSATGAGYVEQLLVRLDLGGYYARDDR